jgi:hypothetical protein
LGVRGCVSEISQNKQCKAQNPNYRIAEDVPISTEDDDGAVLLIQTSLETEGHIDIVNSAHVAAARRLRLFGIESERVAVNVALGDAAVVLVGLDGTVVFALSATEANQVVQAKLNGLNGVHAINTRVVEPVVGIFVNLTTESPDEFNDGVVELERNLNLAAVGVVAGGLELRNQLIEVGQGEAVAFLDVQVNERGIDEGRQIVIGKRLAIDALDDSGAGVADNNAVTEGSPGNVQLNTVELESAQGESITRSLGEPEGQRNIETLVETSILDQLETALALANHFLETLTGLARQLFPHVQIVAVKGVNLVATNDQLSLLNNELTNTVDPVSPGLASGESSSRAVAHLVNFGVVATTKVLETPRSTALVNLILDFGIGEVDGGGNILAKLGEETSILSLGLVETVIELNLRSKLANVVIISSVSNGATATTNGGQINNDVEVVNQITSAVQSNLREATECGLALERLADGIHGKVGVTGITETPEGHGSTLDQVGINGAESNKLINSTLIGSTE